MRREPIRTLYVRGGETRESISQSEITRGLSSRDLNEKSRIFNQLISQLLSDPDTEPQLLSVISNVLPYQGQSTSLKKSLLIYWEVVNKRKLEGGVLDEFLLVCNNLRNDLNHANEFVVGLALKLIGRIAVREILDALIEPIRAKLKHVEGFVKRNAVECLYEIYTKVGGDALPDVDQSLIELLSKETDQNVIRNSLLFLFKLSPESAIGWVSERLASDGLDSLSELVQLSALRELLDLAGARRLGAGKLLGYFLESRFNCVQFELAAGLPRIGRSSSLAGPCAAQLLRIAQESPDLSVKLVVLDTLAALEGQSSPGQAAQLLKILAAEAPEVQLKALKLVRGQLSPSNAEAALTAARQALARSLGNSGAGEARLRRKLVELVELLVERHRQGWPLSPAAVSEVLGLLLQDPGRDESLRAAAGRLLREAAAGPCGPAALEALAEQVFVAEAAEPLRAAFAAFASHLGAPQAAALLRRLGSKEFLEALVVADRRLDSEERKEQTRPKFDALVCGILGDTVFAVGFFRACVEMMRRVGEPGLRPQLLLLALKVYSSYQRRKEADPSFFVEMNQLVKELSDPKSEIRPLPAPLKLVSRATDSEHQSQAPQTQPNDPLFFKLLSRDETDPNPSTPQQLNSSTPQPSDVCGQMRRLFPLTGYSDPIYAEAQVVFTRNEIEVDLLLINRTDTPLKSVSVDFFAVGGDMGRRSLRPIDRIRFGSIRSGDSAKISKTLSASASSSFEIFAEISFENAAGLLAGCLKTAGVSLDLLEFIEPKNLPPETFRHIWQACDWENKAAFKRKTSLNELQRFLTEKFKLSLVPELSIGTSSFASFALYGKFLLGKDLLLNLNVDLNDNECCGAVRVRSQDMAAVVLMGRLLKKLNN